MFPDPGDDAESVVHSHFGLFKCLLERAVVFVEFESTVSLRGMLTVRDREQGPLTVGNFQDSPSHLGARKRTDRLQASI